MANGDGVDYYTFTTDGRYTLGLGARVGDQRKCPDLITESTHLLGG